VIAHSGKAVPRHSHQKISAEAEGWTKKKKQKDYFTDFVSFMKNVL
jgi:hypothetical protein